ncbi:hypothetical protein QYF61_006282 [Mycteria americana]|uniref:Uncharacterized protein n=1 Tax=Mycteria americana TaxID=33587 RepID=A0AAN7NFR9_MYCAM|nr:hypothetical protein QYF61_006282 [Mycteria americana]
MYNSTYMFDDDSDDELPTQQAIQESLQDRHKIETSGSATEDERYFQYVTSKEHGKIIAAIRTVKYKYATLSLYP